MTAPQTAHPLADSFASALFATEEPDAVEFLMLLTEVSQLSPTEFASLWCDVVAIGRGAPVSPRERAAYALAAPARVAEATRLATILGEVSPTLQVLVVRTLRLTVQRQRGRAHARVESAVSGMAS
jgi:hypothetical protein